MLKLRQYAKRRPTTPVNTWEKGEQGREHCELCSLPLASVHRHLLETVERRVVCACDACAMRFQDVVGGRFQLIPRDARELPDFHLEDRLWDGFALPINLVFFFHSTPANRMVALYPSPAGATESLLPLESWEQLVARNPLLSTLKPDVEALLVNRVKENRRYLLAPMDKCYALVGLIRMNWRGLSGGEEMWEKIDAFFDELSAEARPATLEDLHA